MRCLSTPGLPCKGSSTFWHRLRGIEAPVPLGKWPDAEKDPSPTFAAASGCWGGLTAGTLHVPLASHRRGVSFVPGHGRDRAGEEDGQMEFGCSTALHPRRRAGPQGGGDEDGDRGTESPLHLATVLKSFGGQEAQRAICIGVHLGRLVHRTAKHVSRAASCVH